MNEPCKQIRSVLERRLPDILMQGFFLGAELVEQPDSDFGQATGWTARIETDAPCPGVFFFCAPAAQMEALSSELLGVDDLVYDNVADIMAEFANVVAGRIALDLQYASDSEPKIGLPKVGQDLFPPPEDLDIHLRFRVEAAFLSVGWKASES